MSSLPTGAVTFLFADVEGSTRLARELGDQWLSVLAEVRRLLREAVAKSDGHEVDSRGDELFAAFGSPEAAASAAADAQRLLGGHNWPTPVRVRIGLHTGTAALDEDGYVGVDVHRAYRIASAGHGGQIVASETAAAALTPERDLR
ncbi:MAG: adenylate/guanylate cyclase domain-containing protein, partial [Actinobacteria bacterium]|nr:adenylate/guanylate cyclase domain-containing protein [Actinomycetota bacterium]